MIQYRIAILFACFLFLVHANLAVAQENATKNENTRVLIEDDEDDVSDDEAADVDGEEEDAEADTAASEADTAASETDTAASETDTTASADAATADLAGTAAEEEKAQSVVAGHGMQLAMSFNGVPNAMIDHWFSNHGEMWDGVASMGFALDYFLRFRVPCELRISLSWVNARTGDAYWLDKDYADRPELADYVRNGLSMVNLEVAAYHMIDMAEWATFYYGGGIWGGVVLGNVESYAIRESCASDNDDWTSCPHVPGSVPVTGIPPVFGFVMVSLGVKFQFLEVMTARVEAGYKGYFYGQLGLGVEF